MLIVLCFILLDHKIVKRNRRIKMHILVLPLWNLLLSSDLYNQYGYYLANNKCSSCGDRDEKGKHGFGTSA